MNTGTNPGKVRTALSWLFTPIDDPFHTWCVRAAMVALGIGAAIGLLVVVWL